MTKKSADCYAAVFNYIKNHVFDLKPAMIMTDWEAGMRCAIRTCFPNSILKGCWYHYCAALRKKLLRFGLHRELKENALARLIKQMMMSLPLLPQEMFEEGYTHTSKIWQRSINFGANSNVFLHIMTTIGFVRYIYLKFDLLFDIAYKIRII